ncbi:deoxyribodipyrimidine photo-lyase [Nocardioides sp.]|uniref:cryptochrome/photolyase family protein n=1 Tax=Nocardioides sp. TaxID=35761 RepID=UPI00261FA6FE|nr:deoxyribodipyrimidine photo-lyase [Nocardioides sp.]
MARNDGSGGSRSVLWFRRDLRLRDHGALLSAARAGEVLPLFVIDPRLMHSAAGPRADWVLASVAALAADLATYGATLVIRVGDPARVVPEVAREIDASAVYITGDYAPYGRARDAAVATALGPIPLLSKDIPYAVEVDAVRTRNGEGFKVFGPFYRAWLAQGWHPPFRHDPGAVAWIDVATDPVPAVGSTHGVTLPEAGEWAAAAQWQRFRSSTTTYDTDRDRPDLEGTSRMSPYLKIGAVHPRTLLAQLGPADAVFRKELAWREFYASVLSLRPDTAYGYFQPLLRGLDYARGPELEENLSAWKEGRTGFPLVDAGMRQLLAEGWMHNRVRMLVASFLVKDLRVEWTHGARHFMDHLIDGDIASNQHGWQWTAGSGTDAAPYFRVFNPTKQAQTFDPHGDYVRRWVPELRALSAETIHEPWLLPEGPPAPYPPPIVDHAEARRATLADYNALRQRQN